jgi:hypothetical protein
VTAALALLALLRAWAERWVCDDAFISFRYADHFARGVGLVWNPGERVEGITNLLWTVLMAAGARVGLDLPSLSIACGLVSFAALGWVLWRVDRGRIPAAMWVLAATADLAVWATGGLETMTFTALIIGALFLSFGEVRSTVRDLGAGALLGLATLVRPDGVVVAATLVPLVGLQTPGRRLIRGAASGAPVLICVVGVTWFRLRYYGDPLPNTFYAKSAGEAMWQRGLFYLELLIVRDYGLAVALGVLGWLMLRRRAFSAIGVAGLVSGLVFMLYVVRSGGDFMFARRLVPALPLLLVGLGGALQSISSDRGQVGVAACLVLLAALPYPLYERRGPGNVIGGIADEQKVYPPALIELRRRQGEALGRALRGLPATVLIEGGMCVLAYYSHLPALIEGSGLTDHELARQPRDLEGRIGHDKGPTKAFLQRRRVQLRAITAMPAHPESNLIELEGGVLYLRIFLYDEPLMEALARRPAVRFVPASRVLDELERQLSHLRCDRARRALGEMDDYVFRWNPSYAPRRATLERILAARCPG